MIHADGNTVHRSISRYRLNKIKEEGIDSMEKMSTLPAIRSANPMHLPWNQPLQPSHSIMKSLLSCSFNSSSRFWQIQYRCSSSAVDGDSDAFVLVFSGGDCRRDIASRYRKQNTHTKKDRRISWEVHQLPSIGPFNQSVVVFIHSLFNKRSSRISGSYSVQEILLQKQERIKKNPFIKGIHPGRFVVAFTRR